MMRFHRFTAAAAVGIFIGGIAGPGLGPAQDVLEKNAAVPKLISPVDLYCSPFIMETAPQLRISVPLQGGERTLLADGDQFLVDPVPGVESFAEGSLWSILEWGPKVRGERTSGPLGNAVFLRGRARVLRMEAGRAVMEVVKSCGAVTTGLLLVPYIKGDILTGAESSYDIPFREEGVPAGRVVFIESGWSDIVARGHWVLVDIGTDQGLAPGRQMTFYREEADKTPRPIGNSVVVWTGPRWATLKILNSKDSILSGDLVQPKPD